MEDQQTILHTPYQRIGFEHLHSFRGKGVTIVGIPKGMEGTNMLLSLDQGLVKIAGIDSWPEDQKIIIEVRGVLDDNCILHISEYTMMSENFGTNYHKTIDLGVYYKVVRLMQGEFKNLFYDD